MKIKYINATVITISILGLFACNGGESGSNSSPTPTPTPSPSPTPSESGITGNLFCPYTTTPTYLNTIVSSSASSYIPISGGVMSYGSEVCAIMQRTISGNGIPNHATGAFPNSNDPNPLTQQNISFIATLNPSKSPDVTYPQHSALGYSNNGVKLDPGTAATVCDDGSVRQGAPACPWNLEAIAPSPSSNPQANLGLDQCNGHTQPGGWYHYHGLPTCYINTINNQAATSITLIGWALDGFPIYNNYGYSNPADGSSSIQKMKSSWQLLSVSGISSARTQLLATYPMGSFTQDYVYTAGSGDLDECNGRFAVTPDFPKGIYQYYITESFPYIQRCIHGQD